MLSEKIFELPVISTIKRNIIILLVPFPLLVSFIKDQIASLEIKQIEGSVQGFVLFTH